MYGNRGLIHMKPKLAKRNEPEYFLRVSRDAPEEGPYSIAVLREKAAGGEITGETWFRLAEEDEYRLLGEDGPLAADLWPEEEAFDPEAAVSAESEGANPAAGNPQGEEGLGDQDGNAAGILGANVQREREARAAVEEPSQGFDWASLLALKWLVVRWVLAIGLAVWGVVLWRSSAGDSALAFFVGLLPIAVAICLTAPETVRWVITPATALVDSLMEGSGGGKSADFWTADSLMEQGEYNLAAAEYRRLALQYPREIQAYLKGIRASRASNNPKEADRFQELAMKNLKTDQDRNLFLSSLERMK